MKQLKAAADRFCERIMAGLSDAEYARGIAELRGLCQRLFPDKLELFQMIYEHRFQRLREQFHQTTAQRT